MKGRIKHTLLLLKKIAASLFLVVSLLLIVSCEGGDGDDGEGSLIDSNVIDPTIIANPGIDPIMIPENLRNILDDLILANEFTGDDAGHYSFVRQIMPILFGRKVRGYDELKVLVDLIYNTNRAQFLAILLNQNSPYFSEYLNHWSEVLVDRFRLHRESQKTMNACFNVRPFPRQPDNSRAATALAACVARNDPTANCSAGQPFNMSDLLRSSLALDDLSAVYRGYLFSMTAHPISGAEITAANKQADLGSTFTHVYTQRKMDCLTCHNTTSSVSGTFDIDGHRSYWNRHFPVPGNFETALFGSAAGRDAREVNAVFRTDIAGGAIQPWGWQSSCGTYKPAGTAIPSSVERVMIGCTSEEEDEPCRAVEPYFTKPLGDTGSVWEVDAALKRGVQLLARHGLRRDQLKRPGEMPDPSCTDHCATVTSAAAIPSPPPSELSTLIENRCESCHQPGGSAERIDFSVDWQATLVSAPAVSGYCDESRGYYYRAVPQNPDASCVMDLVERGEMPTFGPNLTPDEVGLFRTWINNLPTTAGCVVGAESVCELVPESNENEAGFAYLVAMNIVNQTWEEVMGNPLTIANYFPRNDEARDLLWNLTETTFVPHDWSLKALLIEILTSNYFNRRAPANSTLDSAYKMPTVPKPFEVNDPRRPPEAAAGWEASPEPSTPPVINFSHTLNHMNNEEGRSRHLNTMSDQVYRYSAQNLLHSVHKALDWNKVPRLAGSSSTYPSNKLRKNIGQFYHDAEPGFRNVDFQGLLAWEAAHGSCANPDTPDDWVKKVIDSATASGAPYTYRDLAITIRDWLIANGEIQSTVPVGETISEVDILNGLFGGNDSNFVLDNNVSLSTSAQRSVIENQLRQYCGALTESPQFLLAGIADMQLGPKPDLRVCNEEPCDYINICRGLEDSVEEQTSGKRLSCWNSGLDVDWPFGISPRDPRFCPELLCRRFPGHLVDQLEICLRDPIGCIPEPPICRLGCATVDCCGGPGPLLTIDKDPWYWLGNAENGVVDFAENIKVLRRYGEKEQVLEQGMRLQFGDWVIIPPGSHLRIETKDGVFQTPKQGTPKGIDGAGWRMLVTGETAQLARNTFNKSKPISKNWLNQSLKSSKYSGGAAGTPMLPSKVKVEDPRRLKNIKEGTKERTKEQWPERYQQKSQQVPN
ncbi:MAG: hypothetical protein ACRBCI_04565 [Cellvibrionaceae bacterium]